MRKPLQNASSKAQCALENHDKVFYTYKSDNDLLRSAGVSQSMSEPQAQNPVGSDRNPKAYSGCHLLSTD